MDNKKPEKAVDLRDILFDEKNLDPIELFDGNGKKINFEQVAIIDYDKKEYVVLKPIDKIDGIADDEAIVFRIETNVDGETVLVVEADEDTAISVFDEYYNLLEEDQKKKKKK